MDMGTAAFELSYGNDKYLRWAKNTEPTAVPSFVGRLGAERSDFIPCNLSQDQVRKLSSRYDLADLTCEEEESLIQDLIDMDILTVDDGCSYTKSGGDVMESLTRQISVNINLLYQAAIAGRYSSLQIEIIKSQQKILDVLEQVLAGRD
jgi:hypothetical protein